MCRNEKVCLPSEWLVVSMFHQLNNTGITITNFDYFQYTYVTIECQILNKSPHRVKIKIKLAVCGEPILLRAYVPRELCDRTQLLDFLLIICRWVWAMWKIMVVVSWSLLFRLTVKVSGFINGVDRSMQYVKKITILLAYAIFQPSLSSGFYRQRRSKEEMGK